MKASASAFGFCVKYITNWKQDNAENRAAKIEIVANTMRIAKPHTRQKMSRLADVSENDDGQAS